MIEKSKKSKMRDMAPNFEFYAPVVVVVRRGCGDDNERFEGLLKDIFL